jgi:hypothetical protein
VAIDSHEIMVADLERWEDPRGAWRALEISDTFAILELCACYGEPVDTVQTRAPELIERARSRRQTD